MTDIITILDSDETAAVLSDLRHPVGDTRVATIADQLLQTVDTGKSVFATGMDEHLINAIRTRLYRQKARITVRKVQREGQTGHVLLARSVE